VLDVHGDDVPAPRGEHAVLLRQVGGVARAAGIHRLNELIRMAGGRDAGRLVAVVVEEAHHTVEAVGLLFDASDQRIEGIRSLGGGDFQARAVRRGCRPASLVDRREPAMHRLAFSVPQPLPREIHDTCLPCIEDGAHGVSRRLPIQVGFD
jgi:hypothetical protein